MGFAGNMRGRVKAASTVRIVYDGNATNNASMSKDLGVATVATMNTSTYLEIFSSLTNNVNYIEIFDSSGYTIVLATGAAGVEVPLMLITPGGNGFVPVHIDAGTRVVIVPGSVGMEIVPDVKFIGDVTIGTTDRFLFVEGLTMFISPIPTT